MNTLRQQNQLCDVVLKAANTEVHAHRVVLASSSPYFLAMFTSELSESRQGVVTLQEVDSEALKLLVDVVYTSEIEVTEDNVQVGFLGVWELKWFTDVWGSLHVAALVRSWRVG